MTNTIFNIFNYDLKLNVSTAISASAGTGKTTAIEHAVLRLVLGIGVNKPVDTREILIISFSRAAVRELQERISKIFYKAFAAINKNDYDALGRRFPYILVAVSKNKSMLKCFESRLAGILANIDAVQIYTVDSVLEHMIQFFYLDKKFKKLPEHYSNELQEESFRKAIRYILSELEAANKEILESILDTSKKSYDNYYMTADKPPS